MTPNKPRFVGEKVKLSDVAKVNPKADRSAADKDLVSFLPLAAVHTDGTTESGKTFERGEVKKGHPYFKRGDILVAKITPSFENGKIAIASCEMADGYSSTEFLIVRPDLTRVEPNYLLAYLRSSNVRTFCSQRMKGSAGQKRVPKEILAGLTFELPTMDVQQKRATKFGKIAALIAFKNQQIEKLDQLVKSRFVEMFGDPVDGCKWNRITLDDLCSKLGSGATPRGGKSAYKEEGTPLIRSMNVHNGRFEKKDLAFIDDEQAGRLKNVELKQGDVLLNITGASVARSCVLPNDLVGGRVNQHVAIVRCDQSRMLPLVLNAVFISDSYQRFLLNGSKMAGATREAITKDDLKKMSVPLPPLELQQKFADFAAQVDKSRFVEMFGSLQDGYKCGHGKLGAFAVVGSSKRVFKEELLSEGIPFYRGTEIAALSGKKPFTPELFISSDHYARLVEVTGRPQVGDLLMPSICPDGQVWCVDNDEPFYFKDGRVLWVRPDRTALEGVFLRYALSIMFQMSFYRIASGTTFAELKIFLLKDLDVPMPSLEQQREFVDFTAQVDKSRFGEDFRVFFKALLGSRSSSKSISMRICILEVKFPQLFIIDF